MDEKQNNIEDIDVNSPDFYEKVQTEIDSDMARMKKSVEVMLNLRMEAAEIEVQQAALFHAEVWYDLLVLQNDSQAYSEDEDYDEAVEKSQTSTEVNAEDAEANK